MRGATTAASLGLSGVVGGGDPSLEWPGSRLRFFGLPFGAEEHKASMNMSDSMRTAAMAEIERDGGD